MKHWPLRLHLFVMAMAVALPLLVASLYFGHQGARHQRLVLENGIADVADALGLAIDNELRASTAALQALSVSTSLQNGDLARFYAEAGRVRGSQNWYTVWLIDPGGRPVMNLLRPLGTQMPSVADRDYFVNVLKTGKPAVSDLLEGRMTAGYQLVVGVPVIIGGELKYVLAGGFRPEVLSDMLQRIVENQQRAQPGALVSIVDGQFGVVARTRDPEKWIGKKATPEYIEAISHADKGVLRTVNLERESVVTGFKRIGAAGWTVGVAVPAAVVDEPVRRVDAWVLWGTLAVLAVALGAAALFGRAVVRPISAAADSAEDIAQGRSVDLPRTQIAEVKRLNDALVAAARQLAAEHARREQAEAERASLLEQAHEARKIAEEANRAKDIFLATLSHELRNPLAAINNSARLLEHPRIDDESARHAREVIMRQVEHLTRMTDDLLDIGRAVSGKVVLHEKPLDLSRVAAEVVRSQRIRLSSHLLSCELAPTWVSGDETRIAQVLANLLTNAVRCTPQGKAITVTVRPEGNDAVMRVADQGIGMSPRLLSKAFDLFVQGERTHERNETGLGIGLTLVRRLVEMHRGSVQAFSAGPGLGSEFVVRLPLVPEAGATVDGAALPQQVKPRDVLIVEDNDDTRESLIRLLELDGHKVRSARDGAEGLEKATEEPPDIALVDIGLPKVDGFEFARRLRKAPGAGSPFLVAVTGYGAPEDKAKALAAGFNTHVTKPVSGTTLRRIFSALG